MQLKKTVGLAVLLWLGIHVPPACALINNSQYLVVDNTETLQCSGDVYKSVSIYVKAGGTLKVVANSDKTYRLNLISPCIQIEGQITADAMSLSTTGKGTEGAGACGDGGGGFGGAGGAGGTGLIVQPTDIVGQGGGTYNLSVLELCGSMAAVANTHTRQGYGGGSIRLDAISLTIAATAELFARGGTQGGLATGKLGGGSGGCIYLNGIDTWLETGSTYSVRGGDGEGQTLLNGAGGGGGGGGRIKIVKHPQAFFSQGTLSTDDTGGLGGHNAQGGGTGTFVEWNAALPTVPVLISPDNDQLVGQSPTLNFQSSDAIQSKFLTYKLEISDSDTFSVIVLSADQTLSTQGWTKSAYYFNEIAGFTVPIVLDINKVYYWHVAVSNNNGATFTGWSAVRDFRTVNNTPPLVPQLIQPAQAAIGLNKTPAFQVEVADREGNSITCTLLLSTDSQMSNPKAFLAAYPGWDQPYYLAGGSYVGITATCQILNSSGYVDALDPGTTYYWKVIAYDQYQESTESTVNSFTTLDKPTTPVVSSPQDGTVLTIKNPWLMFSSQSPTNSQLQYKLEMSSDNFQTVLTFLSANGGGWTKPAYASGEIAQLFITPNYSLVSGNTYSWQAAAYDMANDNWSDMTDICEFTVITAPFQPELLAPADHYLAPDGNIILQFMAASESGNTLTYRVELSTDNFQSIQAAFDQQLDSSGWSAQYYSSNSPVAFALPGNLALVRGRDYAWRVKATDGISWGLASDSRTFQLSNSLELEKAVIGPNPAVSVRNLRLQVQVSVDADTTFRFFNKLGKEIGRMSVLARGGLQGNEFAYDISHFAPGVYYCIIEIKSAYGEKKITKRFAVVN